jgi:8-amino-3,8-dideoxy-alpha-D-manno-octulosonate transaminase
MPGYELIDDKEQKAITNIFENNGGVLFQHGFDKLRNGNYEVRELEKKAAEFFGSKYVLAVSSGTAGLKIALKCIDINPGDEIITQAHNFISDGEVISDYNATCIVVNIDKSLNLDTDELKHKITSKTKAVIVSDMLGNGNNITIIEEICNEHNILLIDDACEMIGGKYNGKYYGTFGDIGVFSLDFGKNITSGEGGLIFTDNEKYYNIMKEYFDHGHKNNPNFPRGQDDFGMPGFNFRMTEIQGAIAKVQIDKLNYIISENKKRYMILDSNTDMFEKRLIYNKVEPSYDTFIFFVENTILRKLIVNYINSIGFSTKNLPDAMRWHCFYYWDHLIDEEQKENVVKSKHILSNAIAIPILLKENEEFYKNLVQGIKEVYNNFTKKDYTLEIEYLGIIPARSGSKGIKNKNILKLSNNKCLLEIIARNADDSRLLDGVILTTDDTDYVNIYKRESNSKDITENYIRPKNIAQDQSLPHEYIFDVLDFLKNQNIVVKNIVLLQVTSPLYSYNDIDNAIIKFKNSDKKTLVSVCEPIQHPSDMIYSENEKLIIQKKNSNRQDYTQFFFENGCIYISELDEFLNTSNFLNENTELFKMNIQSGIDVDNDFDLTILNKLLEK